MAKFRTRIMLTIIMALCLTVTKTSGQAGTLGFYLNGVAYPNGSAVLREDIGESGAALQCTTDSTICCNVDYLIEGSFYFPYSVHGSVYAIVVPRNQYYAEDGYYQRQYFQHIRLHREPTGNITGEFRCDIWDANFTHVNLYINIIDIIVNITTSGNGIAGGSYSLVCSVEIVGSTDQPNITWIDPMNDTVPFEMISATDNTSTLTFNPLSVSHAGNYTCRAILDGAIQEESLEILVLAITSLNVESSFGTNTAGETYSLKCSATVAGSTDAPSITWFDDGVVINSTDTTSWNVSETEYDSTNDTFFSTLTYSPLATSHAGMVTCMATLGQVTDTQPFNVTVKIPVPMVMVLSDPVNPVQPVGSANVTLTCTVKLNPSVDVPVTVNTVWTGPDNFNRNITLSQQMGSTTTYTSTVMVSSFGRDQSGNYTCRPTVSSISSFIISPPLESVSFTVTVGVYLSLNGVFLTNNSDILITDIGTSSEPLVCTTDRMPCCRTPTAIGEWNFPDGEGLVPTLGGATKFYTNRSESGEVNLFRRSGDVMAPVGTFCCEVLDAADVYQTVCANIVSLNVTISPLGSPTAGETYSLECSASVSAHNENSIHYQWLVGPSDNRTQANNDGTIIVYSTSIPSQLQFSTLKTSHGGMYYTCQVSVGELVAENAIIVEVILPPPTAVTVTHSLNTIIVGASFNLTCTVELTPAVDVPVTVNTVWTGPDMTSFTPTNPVPVVMENQTRYTGVVRVDAARSGNYTCHATVNSSSSFGSGSRGSMDIIVVPIPPPTNVVVSPTSSPTSISLTWTQPEGAEAVDSYEINYSYNVTECVRDGDTRTFPPVTVTSVNGYQRSYTIFNSPTTPVEEDSQYTISINAINGVGRSAPSNMVSTTTAGAAPGLVQSLRVTSVSITNITIHWEHVDCQQRNGRVHGYRVFYYPTSNPSDRMVQTIAGSDRMFITTALSPRTSYTFEVQASSSDLGIHGEAVTITVNTSAPEDFGFLLNGRFYPNSSVVSVTDIHNGPSVTLFCLTPNTECCSFSETQNGGTVGEWYLPDGALLSTAGTAFTRGHVASAVSLNRRSSGTSPTGLFRCDVPDASGTSQSIYIGIYAESAGSATITSVLLDRHTTTLTCTSTGGPPTSVTWRKNGIFVNDTFFEQSQRVVNTENATYENILFSNNIAYFIGAFACEVSNARGRAIEIVELNGLSITHSEFVVGTLAVARCTSDTPTASMEWLANGAVVESATSIQMLDLIIPLVNDSIHGNIYVCRVIRNDGMMAMQNFTVKVVVPLDSVTSTVSRSGTARAGMVYNLTCTVSKGEGLLNFPTASWTTGSGGVAVSNGNSITISTSSNGTSTTSTLTFDPLRTSHNGAYMCVGSLNSPALQMPLTPSETENFAVQISTPAVAITVPPGPLYAGQTTPVVLTCSISLNPATDTGVSLSNSDIMWMNGTTPLSNGDPRVTIYVDSSQLPYSSTLSLFPLSIFDTTRFTCGARVRPSATESGFITASDSGAMATSISLNSPAAPTVSVVHSSNGSILAGEQLILTCSATVQEGILGSPILTWSRDGVELSDEASSSSLLFRFSPLLTSHGGVYMCTARLAIPEAGVDVTGTNTAAVRVQIPAPTLAISGSPRNRSFFQGLDLTLTCSITLDEVVDTPVMAQGTWNRNGTEFIDGMDSGRVTIVNHVMSAPPYWTAVRFNLLNNFTDVGTYECIATVIPVNSTFISGAESAISRTITVAGFPRQDVDPIAGEGISMAGVSTYTLICSTRREPDLPPTATLTVLWIDPSGSAIVSGTNFTISQSGPSSDASLTSRLTFNSLHTSQAGVYMCRSLQTIPGIATNHTEQVSFLVRVKLPPQSPPIFHLSRNTALNAGTNFSLTCLIAPNTTGVDTAFTVQSTVTGPQTSNSERVAVSQLTPVGGETVYKVSVIFRYLIEADSGSYTCTALLTSAQDNVVASDSVSALKSITIGSLQPPSVSILPTSITAAGTQNTLVCTVTVEEYLQATPTLSWRLPGNTDDTFIGPQLNAGTTSNLTLILSPLRTSHGGTYVCAARVEVGDIVPQRLVTASESIRVLLPPPVISFHTTSTPYNGTNFTLTGIVEMAMVDVDIATSAVWSDGRTVQETFPPYLTNLTFRPLATNSSGQYTLSVTVQPLESSEFIVGNNASNSYNLTVRPLPHSPPKITVASRSPPPDGGCGEARIINCTDNQVENLFAPPDIRWRDLNDRPVPTEGGSNPRVDPETRQLIFTNITESNSGRYLCEAVISIPEAQIVEHIDAGTIDVNTNIPGSVQELSCMAGAVPTELSLSWEVPTQSGEDVVDYQVDVKELRHREGTREIVQADVDNFTTAMKQVTITEGLASEIPYNFTVTALTPAGCGPEKQIYCFTIEGDPPPPTNVMVVKFDSTSIGVSWTKFTLVELKGLANYIVTYNIIIGSRKRQLGGTVTVPWTTSRIIITDLQPGAEYEVTVSTSTAAGTSEAVGPSPAKANTDHSLAIIVGGAAATVVAIALIIAATVAMVISLRNRRGRFEPNERSDRTAASEPGTSFNNYSSTINEGFAHNKSAEDDHEYELLEKYSQPNRDEAKLSQAPPTKPKQLKTASTGDYEFTQCPAYGPVTRGNGQVESLLTQPSTGLACSTNDGGGMYEAVNEPTS